MTSELEKGEDQVAVEIKIKKEITGYCSIEPFLNRQSRGPLKTFPRLDNKAKHSKENM